MDATRNVGDRGTDASVRLSSAQKRDVMSMFAAATITAGLMVAPAIAPHDQYVALLASRSVHPITTAPVVVASRFVESPIVTTARRPVRAAAVRRAMTPPALVASAVRTPPVVVAVNARLEPPVVLNARLDNPRKPLGRRLAGFLTGDGTHSIRPFPTVSTER